MSTRRTTTSWLGAALAIVMVAAPLAAQQTGSVTGVVRTETGDPVVGAQVTVVGTGLGTLSRADGGYLIQNVPAGTQTVRVELIGYAATTGQVTVAAGETASLNFDVALRAVALQEIIVTGVSGATVRAKVPFEVAQLRQADLPVPAVNAAMAIQGKVAGASVVSGSGRPGAAQSILLRGATSINASGRDQEPLYIVDGVILGSEVVDIDGLDIDNIEVIKGAAAASLYGSRAAAGVINITTRRGSQMSDGQVRYAARSSFGSSDLPGKFDLLQNHFWELTPDGTRFIDGSGDRSGLPCDFRGAPGWNPDEECSANPRLAGQTAGDGSRNQWNTFATNPWPRGTFDNVGRFFDGGMFQEHYVSATGRQGATNFHVSFQRSDDEGVMLGQEGFARNNFRVNVDQVVRPNISVSASAFYSKSDQQDFTELSGNPVFGLTRMQAGVDLAACEPGVARTSCLDDPENLLLNVNPTNLESANPLYELLVTNNNLSRGRFLASTNLRYSPTNWLDVDGDASFDRLDQERFFSLPKGYRTISASTSLNNGQLQLSDWRQEALNASATATLRHMIADGIANRTQLRYLYEQQERELNSTFGHTFSVVDVETFGNINAETLEAANSHTTIRSDGYFVITNFDIYDRYIIDALIRNDGSSLFGADERRQWYHRLAAAWRIAQEPWFNVGAIDELKLRVSRGTAGGRPNFSAQYETYSVTGGQIVPINLGNRNLKPEHSTELEFGVDMGFANRFDLSVTRANTVTTEQILTVPLPAFMGFSSQVQNVGTLESNTWEVSLGGRLVQTRNLNWSARVLYDQTESIITELNRPSFRYGVPGQNMGNVFFARVGEKLGTFYGPVVARECGDLPSGISCDGFIQDENGYLVWVGAGGLGANAWGTTSPDGLPWGTPIRGECTDRESNERTNICPTGNTLPDYSVSLSSTLEWRGLSLYGLLDAVQGFDVYNQPLSWGLFRRNIGMMDQSGVPEGQRKPIGYFDALYGSLGGLVTNDVFVQDASFLKLRELSASYRLTAAQLSALPLLANFQSIGLNVSGRNLKTWSDYNGYDPEVGRSGGDTGSAALARVDGYNYPNFRTWTFGIELNF